MSAGLALTGGSVCPEEVTEQRAGRYGTAEAHTPRFSHPAAWEGWPACPFINKDQGEALLCHFRNEEVSLLGT